MIESVRVDRLSVPLAAPYRLASVTLEELDVVLATITDEAGRTATGEATTLEGYFDATPDQLWRAVTGAGERLVGLDAAPATNALRGSTSRLAESALGSAIDGLEAREDGTVRAPIVGIASASREPEPFLESVRTQVETGTEVVKVKVGFDPETDAARVVAASRAMPDDVTFRADANQQYSLDEAESFLSNVGGARLSLLEQPLPTGRYDDHARLRSGSEVPIMLDEDVRGTEELEAVLRAGAADAVKFKLMKQGGPERVRSLVRRARREGLTVVLGNGVQTGVGCVHEARLWAELDLDTAGEFNGWRKLSRPVAADPPRFESGSIVVPPGPVQVGDLEPVLEESVTYGE